MKQSNKCADNATSESMNKYKRDSTIRVEDGVFLSRGTAGIFARVVSVQPVHCSNLLCFIVLHPTTLTLVALGFAYSVGAVYRDPSGWPYIFVICGSNLLCFIVISPKQAYDNA
jgi:hypothetical protein